MLHFKACDIQKITELQTFLILKHIFIQHKAISLVSIYCANPENIQINLF